MARPVNMSFFVIFLVGSFLAIRARPGDEPNPSSPATATDHLPSNGTGNPVGETATAATTTTVTTTPAIDVRGKDTPATTVDAGKDVQTPTVSTATPQEPETTTGTSTSRPENQTTTAAPSSSPKTTTGAVLAACFLIMVNIMV